MENLQPYIYKQPHLFIYGDVGSGKHQTVYNFLKLKYLTQKEYRHAVHWLYCFDGETQHKLVEIIKRIGQQIYKPITINHRVIVLDSTEFISYQSQASLRRCIEQFSKQTRFIFIGNHYGNIMKPIQSRCVFVKIQNYHTTTVKQAMKYFGKRSNHNSNCSISLHSLDKTRQKVGERYIHKTKPYQCEYNVQKQQFKWLKSFIKSTDDDITIYATQWVNQGWSVLDLLGCIVWETKIWISQYDTNGIRKLAKNVWQDYPMSMRYELWKKVNGIMKGQHHEIFWTSWVLGELRLLSKNNIAKMIKDGRH